MINDELVPAEKRTENSTGEAFDLSAAKNRVFLFDLEVVQTLEQQALDVLLEWSTDGVSWGRMAAFPQQFYRGCSELMLDCRNLPQVHWVRARWVLERWGRGSNQTSCEFRVGIREVTSES